MTTLRSLVLCLTFLAAFALVPAPVHADVVLPDAVIPVAGTTAGGAGANFRTEAQLHNPSASTMRGRLVFVWQGIPVQPNPVAELAYELAPRQTVVYEDLVGTMGGNGLGSIDVFAEEGGVPVIVVRAFDDQGDEGTAGLMVPVLPVDRALEAGERIALVVPNDLTRYRYNVGVRTLPDEADSVQLRIVARDASGEQLGDEVLRDFPKSFFAQTTGEQFLGRPLTAGSSLLVEVLSGRVILYSTTTDNTTNDGSIQIDRVLNLPPVIDPGAASVTTPNGTPVTIPFRASDPDDDEVEAKLSAEPSHGEVTIAKSEASDVSYDVTYAPEAGFGGEDAFELEFDDGNGGKTLVTVVVTVGEGNSAPIALGNAYTFFEDETLTVTAPGILANDFDADGDALTAVLISGPSKAANFTLNEDGSLTYTPKSTFAGTDTFTYRADDGTTQSNLATVALNVKRRNTAPKANPDTAVTDEDTAILIDVVANDDDNETPGQLTVMNVTTTGTLGTVTVAGNQVSYDPTTSAVLQALAVGSSAIDTFQYTVRDPGGLSGTTTVNVTVNGVDDLPTAVADAATLAEDAGATAIGVLANDTDPEGDAITITGVTQGTSGTVAITGGGTGLTYAPNADFCGSDTFTYTVNGGSIATVTVTVTCVNDAPSFTKGVDQTVLEDAGAQTVNGWASGLSAGPADEAGQTLSFVIDTNSNTALFSAGPAVDAAGNLTYTPAADANGLATITLHVTDNGGTANGGVDASATQSFVINVTAVNDAPSFTKGADQTVLEESGPHTVNGWATGMSAGPADEAGQTLTFDVTNDNNGLFLVQPAIDATGTLTYTLATDASGAATVLVSLMDSGGSANGGVDTSAVQTFAITVTDVNDAPSTTGDAQSTAEDTTLVFAAATLTTNDSPGPANEAGQTLTVTAVVSPTTNGGTVSLSGGNITYTPPVDFIGTDTFTYTVTDDGTTNGVPDPLSAIGTVTVTVICPTITVINPANAGGTAGSPFSESFTQTGDAAGAPPQFTSSSTLPAGLTLATTGVLSGTPTETGTFLIVVTATNGNACSGTGTTYNLTIGCQTITVTSPVNASGTAGSAFSEMFAQTGAIGTATFTTSSALPSGLTLSTSGVLSGTPTQTGTFPIVVTVTDDNGCTGTSATYNLVIGCQTITVSNPANAAGTAGTAFSETFTQTGAIGTATFTTSSALPSGLTLAANGVLSGTPTQTGSFPIVVTVTDDNGCTGTGVTYTLTLACPTITVSNPANAAGTAGSAFSETFTQTGAIGTATFTTASTLPTGLTLATNGTLSGTPTQTGAFPIVVTVTDDNGCTGTSATYNLTIACQTITVTNPANTSGAVSTPFSETFTQTSAIGTATFTTASTLPNGLTLATNGVLSGTPTQTGAFPIVVTVTDDNGCTGTSATYNLTIGCQTITVTNPANASGTASSPFSETFTQTGAVGTATFTTASALPNGLTLAATGVLSGTPTQTGTFPIVVTVTDSNGCTGSSATYNLTIACQTITVTNPANATGPAGTSFSETFTQTGAIGTATFTTASTLPTGLTLATNGVLSGTPTQGGTFPIVVTVTDSNGCTGSSATYNLVITCPTITVNNPVNANGTAGTAFSEMFTQTGGVGTPTFTLASGTLPTGLTLASDGTLSGTPTQTGSFPITVTATDANGCTGTGGTYTIVIACQTITVTNPANASGTANAAFSETFTHTSGIGTVNFTLGSGTVPTGLTLATDGTLSGTPTQTGSFPITVTATDANGCTGTGATYTIVIACQTITVTNPANTSGAISTPFSETFTQTNAIGTATFTTASTLPNGLSLSTAGVLSGTPTQTGTFPIVVTVTDDNGCTGTSATYNLVIGCQTITVNNPANASGTVGSPFSETFTQTNAIGTATFTTASTLPTGLSLSTAGVLSGTPTQSGTFPIVVTVTDDNGCTGTSATYNLVIACNVVTVTNPANANGTAGTAFSETFTQTGGNGTITWSLGSGSLPSGITLDSGTGILSGSTTVVGSFPITVTATDQNGCSGTGATYTLVIACQTITVTNPVVNTGTAGTAFSQTFTQTGILGTPTWSVTGTLPTGITLNTSNGNLSGTTSQTGSFPVTVRVTDTNGCFDDSSYTLTIVCQTITVTNPVVTSGSYNVAFSQTFGVTGILGTATWSVTGTLPAGISIGAGGVLSGTPTQTGSFPVTVRATDTNGCFDDSSYTLTISPAANPDTYTNLINNTQAVVVGGTTASPTTPFASLAFASNLIANDASDAPIVATAETVATTQGGSVTIAADGTFVYTPPVSGVATPLATDGFNYTITSNSISVSGTVSLTLTQRVWYVRNNSAAGGLGRSSDPFDTLAEAEAASFANDYIFVHYGNGSFNNQAVGIVLKAGQSLIGEFMGLSVPVSVNGQASPAVLLAQPGATACGGAACRPQIRRVGNNNTVVSSTDAIPAEISGLRLDPPGGTANAIDLTTTGAFSGSGTLVINQNQVIAGAGGDGIDINAGGTGTLTLDIQNTTFTAAAGGNGIDVTRTLGSVIANISNNTGILANGAGINVSGGAAANTTITGFASNTVSGNSAGAGITVSNVTFDATAGGNFDVVSGGNTVIGASGNPVGTSGITLTTVSGHLNFTDLDIFTTNGAGLTVSGTGALAAASGTQVTVQNASTSDVNATNGPAVSVSSATVNTVFNSVTSTNSGSTGVSLTTVGGTFTAGSGSSITNATGTDFFISGGTANVTYNGTITDATGTVVSIASATGGTKSFTGAISGGAISLTSNTGATINFSGGVTLSTGTAAAFTATGGGTVNVTGTNTLTTTTGTALNVTNTTIGASGLTFRSVSSNGATNGIVLNSTGSSGSLTVTGNGGGCTSSGTCTGGAIQNSTGTGVLLTSTAAPSLTRLFVGASGTHGLHATTLASGLTLTNCYVQNSGNADNEYGMNVVNMTGTLLISGTTFDNAADNLVYVTNTGALTFTVNGNSVFSYPVSVSGTANSAILLEPSGSGSVTASITSSTFTNIVSASAQIGSNTAGANGTHNFTFSNNTITSSAGRAGTVFVSGQESTTTNVTISNNMFTGAGGNGVIGVDVNDASLVAGTIAGNTIANPPGVGMFVAVDEDAAVRLTLNGNVVTNSGGDGIQLVNFGGVGTSDMYLAVTNNQVNGHSLNTAVSFVGGISVTSFEDTSCIELTGNSVTGTPASPTQCGGAPCVDYYIEEVGGTMTFEEVPNTADTTLNAARVNATNDAGPVTIFGTIDLTNGAQCAFP